MDAFIQQVCASLVVTAIATGQTQPPTAFDNRHIAAPTSRLRPASGFEAGVIAEGVCRSPTVRAMVTTIQVSNVIVYIAMRRFHNHQLAGGLEFIGATTTDRILGIVIGFPLDRIARIAMLGHELQHAVEVARRPEITSRTSFNTFYATHAKPGAAEWTYETDEAYRTELQVRAEVWRSTASCKEQ